MRRRTVLLLVAVVLAASWGAAQEATETPVSDADLSLARGSVFEVLLPPVPAVNRADPGDEAKVPRAFDTAPPRVPHAVADFMPIRRDENWCVDCHMTDWQEPEEGEATPISFSHYMDLRSDSTEIGEEIVGARWVCVSCHIPVTDAPPLVGNSFSE